ncbi:MAG: transporter substrate-binding domain-containing protein [Spongiibacteraceae bacterium]
MRRIAAFCLVWLSLACANADEVIRYPRPESQLDHRNEYALELLKLALREAGSKTALIASDKVMTQDRLFSELQDGKNLHVMWTMTTKERETLATPIRIPIYKGLIGWRLALIHASQSDLLARVKTIEDLARYTAGQARDWPDVSILRANNLKVTSVSGYENLFSMLGEKRFDYMPRSVGEIWGEADMHRADGVMVDPYVVIHYPAAVYFFVGKNNPELAKTIELGLRRAIQNGKFDRLFYSYYAAAIEKARLAERTVIELKNPSLPEQTPLNEAELWLQLPRSTATRTPIRNTPSP